MPAGGQSVLLGPSVLKNVPLRVDAVPKATYVSVTEIVVTAAFRKVCFFLNTENYPLSHPSRNTQRQTRQSICLGIFNENRQTQGAREDPKGGREGEQATRTSNELNKTIMLHWRDGKLTSFLFLFTLFTNFAKDNLAGEISHNYCSNNETPKSWPTRGVLGLIKLFPLGILTIIPCHTPLATHKDKRHR